MNKFQEKVMRILTKNHRGSSNAVSVDELSATLGVTTRFLRETVRELRRGGHPIGSSTRDRHGYFYIDSVKELDATIAQLNNRSKDMLMTANRLGRHYHELSGQLELDLFGP